MHDSVDQIIQRCRQEMHEQMRVSAAHRRHQRDRRAEANVRVKHLEDRIAFHVPIRDPRPEESERDYERYVREVQAFRNYLLIKALAQMYPQDSVAYSPTNELGERLDF